MKTFFGGHPTNDEILAQKVARKLFAQVWGKHQKFACSYTYAGNRLKMVCLIRYE